MNFLYMPYPRYLATLKRTIYITLINHKQNTTQNQTPQNISLAINKSSAHHTTQTQCIRKTNAKW